VGSAYKRVYFDLPAEVDAQFSERVKAQGLTKKAVLESLITQYVEQSKHGKAKESKTRKR
jgi:hypothetical protein